MISEPLISSPHPRLRLHVHPSQQAGPHRYPVLVRTKPTHHQIPLRATRTRATRLLQRMIRVPAILAVADITITAVEEAVGGTVAVVTVVDIVEVVIAGEEAEVIAEAEDADLTCMKSIILTRNISL